MKTDTHTHNDNSHSHSHEPKHYIKIWAILLGLLIVSICGPMLGIRSVTLLTAFGIAIVKAVMVASEFMHLKVEKKYITYMLLTMLFFVFIFFFGVAADVMKPTGQHWMKLPMQESTTSTEHHE